MGDAVDEVGGLPAAPEPKSRSGKEIMALQAGGDIRAIVPRTVEEAFRYAQMVCMAGLAPKSYEGTGGAPDPQKVVIGILCGSELGVPPMQALSGIAIINGRPAVWGDLALALVQSKGLVADHETGYTGEPGTDGYEAYFRIWRKGQPKPYEGLFSIGKAKRAQLWGNVQKKPWIQYPERMLFNRARAFALRDGFSDALKGLAIAEEAQDMPREALPPPAIGFLDDATEAVAGDAPAGQDDGGLPPAVKSEALARGLDILSRTKPKDIPDLHETILSELTDPLEKVEWDLACGVGPAES